MLGDMSGLSRLRTFRLECDVASHPVAERVLGPINERVPSRHVMCRISDTVCASGREAWCAHTDEEVGGLRVADGSARWPALQSPVRRCARVAEREARPGRAMRFETREESVMARSAAKEFSERWWKRASPLNIHRGETHEASWSSRGGSRGYTPVCRVGGARRVALWRHVNR